MFVQAAGLGELFAALVADKVFLAGMDRQVLPKGRIVGKYFGAIVADNSSASSARHLPILDLLTKK